MVSSATARPPAAQTDNGELNHYPHFPMEKFAKKELCKNAPVAHYFLNREDECSCRTHLF